MTRSAVAMVNRCLRHQMPELYEGEAIPEPSLPANVRFGMDPQLSGGPMIPEEPSGNGEVLD